MTRQRAIDKNLQNVDKDLSKNAVTSKQAQQDTNDRRHQDALNHKGDTHDNV